MSERKVTYLDLGPGDSEAYYRRLATLNPTINYILLTQGEFMLDRTSKEALEYGFKFPELPRNLHILKGSPDNLPLNDSSVDQAYIFLPPTETQNSLAGIRRVLRPHGSITVCVEHANVNTVRALYSEWGFAIKGGWRRIDPEELRSHMAHIFESATETSSPTFFVELEMIAP